MIRLPSAALLVAALVAALGGEIAVAEPALHFQGDPRLPGYGQLAVELPPAVASLLAAELDAGAASRILSLTVAASATGGDEALPPVYGDYRLDGTRLIFRPAFPLAGGLELVARLDGAALGRLVPDAAGLGSVTARVRTAAGAATATTEVVAVSPAGEVVPANLLRVYLHFSAPMRDHDVARHVRVLDAGGREIALPFVEIRDGLWDPERRRLTLFFHPGRLKRGVGPNLALGTPLREGERYTLVVDRGLRDAAGLPLATELRHPLRVGPVDRASPDPAGWQIALPAAGSREPLGAVSPEPLDTALLRRLVHLETAAGAVVVGVAEASADGRRWSLVPELPWSPGRYRLVVDAALEDLAGNRVDRRFEEEVGAEVEPVSPYVREVTIAAAPGSAAAGASGAHGAQETTGPGETARPGMAQPPR